jgi:hypothetical protein
MIELMEMTEMLASVLVFVQNRLSNISFRDSYLDGLKFRYGKEHC